MFSFFESFLSTPIYQQNLSKKNAMAFKIEKFYRLILLKGG